MLLLDTVLGFIAPHDCLGCGRTGYVLCPACQRTLSPAERRCYRCLRPQANFATCTQCWHMVTGVADHARIKPLSAVYAATPYESVAKELVWRLKFDRTRAASEAIARQLARCMPSLPPQAIIVAVPTARNRARKRGYDQAELLARAYAKRLQRPYASLLLRTGSQEQIGAGRSQRHAQLQGAYALRPSIRPHALAGKTIILVDDVLTTGATLEAAAQVLYEAGAGSVHGLVFAQA